MNKTFQSSLKKLVAQHEALIKRKNSVDTTWNNGVYERFKYPVLTGEHTPLFWRYDLNEKTNPFLMERLGVNCAFNAGAIEWNGKIILMARVEGVDRKSFFAVAESPNGVDNFRFWDEPVVMPETDVPDTNVYDMRLTRHEDGWIYGLFCTERKHPDAPPHDTSMATAACGIARTKDLVNWERLPDLKSKSAQQRNVVLHPEFVNGQYALYTRPQDDFISAGRGGGIGWALCRDITRAEIDEEIIIDQRIYHTIKEVKNGAGAVPLKTKAGWLHVAHGVRGCAAGMRYVAYAFLCDLNEPWKAIARPGGHLIAPRGAERVGDVSNVIFINGAVQRANGEVLLYYASSDTRMHVARTSVDRLVDYCLHTPEDPLRSYACVQQRLELIRKNKALGGKTRDPWIKRALKP